MTILGCLGLCLHPRTRYPAHFNSEIPLETVKKLKLKRRRLLANPFPDLGFYSPAKHSSDFLQPEWQGNVWPGNNLLLGPLKTAKNPDFEAGRRIRGAGGICVQELALV